MHQANVEYWFRLLYNCFHGACYGSVDMSEFSAFVAHLWLWVIFIGYALSAVGLFVIVYCTIRIFELRERERIFYSTLIPVPGSEKEGNPRWKHIQDLASGSTSSEWREAIIEADVMLDDVLTRQGYVGDGVGEKLKSIDHAELKSLNDAWEAHKVRNQIAHEGSEFNLSDTLTSRTIAQYENVFRDFRAI
jgi:hypothetical protein